MDEQKQNTERKDQFQSDTQKLVQKHMSDRNHEITDEELANVRVGMSPGADAPTQDAIQMQDEKVADAKTINDDKIVPGAQKITPWDVTT